MLAIVGLLFLINKLWELISNIKLIFDGPKNMRNLLQKYGKDTWAVVTGSTDGIGKGFS